MPDREKIAIVVAAAGSSRRFGSDKLAADLGGSSVLEVAVDALCRVLPSAPLVVVAARDRVGHWRRVLRVHHPEVEIVAGGPTRHESVRRGVEAARERGAEVVAVHDGARPLVHPDDLRRVVEGLAGADAAVLCAEVTDTVKRVDREGRVVGSLDRRSLRLAQTPQVVRVAALDAAWRRGVPDGEWGDEAELLEAVGATVRAVAARHPNPKLTTAEDLEPVRALRESRR